MTVQSQSQGGSRERDSGNKRVDRELIELLNELRVALPGVQVLFAFMLVVPFSQGFSNGLPLSRRLDRGNGDEEQSEVGGGTESPPPGRTGSSPRAGRLMKER